jgi:hypothetical protein
MKDPKINWTKVPSGYQIGYSSELGPLWLKVIARTPVLKKYTFYLAYKYGHTTITKSPEIEIDSESINFDDPNWKDPRTGKSVQDMVDEGSLAFMEYRQKGKKRQT